MSDRRWDQEISTRWVAIVVVLLVLFIGVSYGIGKGLMGAMMEWPSAQDRVASPVPEANMPSQPPSPRLQTTPERDLARLRQQEERALETTGWVDEGAGVAQVPIEVAMAWVAEHGLPDLGARPVPAPEPIAAGGESP